MTPLINKGEVYTYPIFEYWLDIGKMDDLIRADNEYSKIFCQMKNALIIGYGSAGQKDMKKLRGSRTKCNSL